MSTSCHYWISLVLIVLFQLVKFVGRHHTVLKLLGWFSFCSTYFGRHWWSLRSAFLSLDFAFEVANLVLQYLYTAEDLLNQTLVLVFVLLRWKVNWLVLFPCFTVAVNADLKVYVWTHGNWVLRQEHLITDIVSVDLLMLLHTRSLWGYVPNFFAML